MRDSDNRFAGCGIPRPDLSRCGSCAKNPLQVVIEELIDVGVNAQADTPYLPERNSAGRKGARLLHRLLPVAWSVLAS